MTINVNLSSAKWTGLLKAVLGAAAGAGIAYVSGHSADYGSLAGVIVLALEAAEGVFSFGANGNGVTVEPQKPAA